jgi:hypothetical protein
MHACVSLSLSFVHVCQRRHTPTRTPQFKSAQPAFESGPAAQWAHQLAHHLGRREWFAGGLSIADFVLYERLAVMAAGERLCHAHMPLYEAGLIW